MACVTPGAAAGKQKTMSQNPNLPTRVSVIVFGVTNVAESAAFYRDTLGLEVRVQSDALAFVSLSGLTLILNRELGRAFQPIAGATEIVFPVANVTVAHELLTQRGCRFLNQPREVSPGSWAATFADPDGHKLTVFGPR
jgi:catechol 2,3-dioxygenase-like lactoylglutathione lyase family enzyme